MRGEEGASGTTHKRKLPRRSGGGGGGEGEGHKKLSIRKGSCRFSQQFSFGHPKQ